MTSATMPRRPKQAQTTADVMAIVAEIDRHNTAVGDLVKKIRNGGHPLAAAIVEALEEQCVILASAHDVVDDVVTERYGPNEED